MKSFLLLTILFLSITTRAQIIQDTITTVSEVFSPLKSIHETVSTDSISVTYGRPYKSGMTIFGNLQKFGNVWQPGVDEASTITFAKNVSFAGQNVEAGTYTLFVIPYEDHWNVILNTQLGQWGAYTYEKYKDRNILSVNVNTTTLITPVEQLTVRFPQPTSMIIEWDKVQVTIPVL